MDIIYVMMFGVLYQGREGGPQNFSKIGFPGGNRYRY